ncbi:hypothetical protein RUM44_009129 [Polyplax serrata]|uniref:Basic leucine zipper nuclear factor 1 n=1 Tax=Polyplax serrata TaxID=468196 RepID=A0ABR1ART1_POLSC
MAKQIPPFRRTQGDGMEKLDHTTPTEETVILQPKEIIEPVEELQQILQKTTVRKATEKTLGSAVKLVPQTVDKTTKSILGHLKNKEPKFVPYEPYKAAVRPIVPKAKGKSHHLVSRKKRKETNEFAGIFTSPTKTSEKDVAPSKPEQEVESEIASSQTDWQCKVKALELEMRTLTEENQQLEKQLNFQVQVNGELKNLLVAAVGEDIETKVHVLTEDKLHLAQALLKSSESLTSHQEQTEWLAGQCEVWRSKFLASSVMVEELARWKASLCQKVNEAHEALKIFLDERKQLREKVVTTNTNLCNLRDNFDLHNKKPKVRCSNVLDICDENLKLSKTLLLQLLGMKKPGASEVSCSEHWAKTPAEKSAERVLANPSLLQLTREPDAACTAVVGAAVNLSGQLYLKNHPPKIGCCPQCTGEIKLV